MNDTEQRPLADSPADRYACTLDGLTATAPDGRTATLDHCNWIQIAPCGCVSGIMVAVRSDVVLRTPEQAQREMSGSAADAKLDAKRGFRMALTLHADSRLVFGPGTCEHDPQWGYVPPTREVGGIKWTQRATNEWTHRDADGDVWRVEKQRAGWYLYPVRKGFEGRITVPWLGTKIDEALTQASANVTNRLAEVSS